MQFIFFIFSPRPQNLEKGWQQWKDEKTDNLLDAKFISNIQVTKIWSRVGLLESNLNSLKSNLSCLIFKSLRLSKKSWVWSYFKMLSVINLFLFLVWYTFYVLTLIHFLCLECDTFFVSRVWYIFCVSSVIHVLCLECDTFLT